MKVRLFFVLFIFLLTITVSSSKKTIYFAKITDKTGDVNLVNDLTFSGVGGPHKIMGKKGEAIVHIPFYKIKSIMFTGEKTPDNWNYVAHITLINNEKIKILIHFLLSFYGKTEFSSHYKLEVPNAKFVEFLHDGRYKKCPLCNTIFYKTDLTYCKFCKEKLQE